MHPDDLTADDAIQAASGRSIHREAPGETVPAYVPVPGIPGSTLSEQYTNAQRMIETGDITENQGRQVVQRLLDAHPGCHRSLNEDFINTVAAAIYTFKEHYPPVDRAFCLFRWKHCPCPECGHIYRMFSAWFDDDGALRPGALFS